jgi:hypothetical protein
MYVWYIFPRFGILYQEKSGNPAHHGVKADTTSVRSELNAIIFFIFFGGVGVSDPLCLSSLALHFFLIIFFGPPPC